ncbi:hypothetical protein AVEN_177636-1 [Araneus ventricosus]|uniref:Uncharacterized protein n=1 Tax=Araneus ventricosus TaxID=182803 RepID=A0A4Y2KK62_ARAVE|nr:hypothetical protein AVEN_177636-1 [Araneus ventricosus]
MPRIPAGCYLYPPPPLLQSVSQTSHALNDFVKHPSRNGVGLLTQSVQFTAPTENGEFVFAESISFSPGIFSSVFKVCREMCPHQGVDTFQFSEARLTDGT